MPDILTKTEQVTAPPPGMALYLVLDPNGTPADRWALLSVLAQSTAWSDIYAVQADLPQADTSEDIIPDAVSSPGFLKWDASSLLGSVNDLTVLLGGAKRRTGADVATLYPLPACTYSNGASGVGATLTGDVNGALAAQDFTTMAAGMRLLVMHQANGYENGLYEVTTLGSGGAAFVLTRVLEASTAAHFLQGVTVEVAKGDILAGAQFTAQGTFTIGTTTITWRGLRVSTTAGEAFFGGARNRRSYGTDFEELETTITASAVDQRMPGTAFGFYTAPGAGSQVSQQQGTDTVPGAAGLETGTTSTGGANMRAGQAPFTFSSSLPFAMSSRLKIAVAVSTVAETFIFRVGCFSASVMTFNTPTAGLYFEAPADGSNWLAVCANASTGLAGVDTGQPQSTSYLSLAIRYEPVSGEARYYMLVSGEWLKVATITTNVPSVSCVPGATLLKSNGTTNRRVHIDRYDVSHLDARVVAGPANFMLVP